MLAGARDFLPKPPSIDELTAAIHRAGKIAQDERSKVSQVFTVHPGTGSLISGRIPGHRGKAIVVYSPKGGTGCTTIATNVAIALQSEEHRVLLVDVNLQFGDVPIFINEQAKNSILDLTPRSEELDPEIIEDVITKHTSTGLSLLAAPSQPVLGDPVRSAQFIKVLDYLRNLFDYIIIDTESHLSEIVLASIETGDLIILVTTQDIPSIKSAHEFLNLADTSDISRDKLLFVLNKYDKRISISPDRVGESLHQKIILSIPSDERSVSSSINRGVPLIVENKSHPFSKSILNLSQLITERITQLDGTMD